MEYVEMIKDPELVLGFRELIEDSDPVVVKRTVKVFTSVYYHALRLLASGELEEEIFLRAWTSVKDVADTLLTMVNGCENEGVLTQLVRFLEAAVMSHLMYDLSSFTIVFEKGREIVKTGLKALKDLVTTPYVGGSVFIVSIRALVSIACLRPDLWEPVTDLIKKQLSSLPPTLFDHNVRSLNKTLQRNLFRLLRRAESDSLKSKLIEMMVRVGVSRKVVMPWAPPPLEKKRTNVALSEEGIMGRLTPPQKRSRKEGDGGSGRSTPVDFIKNQPKISSTQEEPTDPRLAVTDHRKDTTQINDTSSNHQISSDPCEPLKDCKDLLFLTSLLPKIHSAPPTKEDSKLKKETEIFDQLSTETVCSLIIEGLDDLPDMVPKGFVTCFETESRIDPDINVMRKHIATMLANYLYHDNKLMSSRSQSPPQSRPNSPEVSSHGEKALSSSNELNFGKSSSISNSLTSSPSSTPPLMMDTDLRQVYQPRLSVADIDMRVPDPRLTRDPRMLKDPRIRKDQQQVQQSDPRIRHNSRELRDPRVEMGERSPTIETEKTEIKQRLDPRLAKEETKVRNTQPRKSRWDTCPNQEFASTSSNSNISNERVSCESNVHTNNRSGLLPHPDSRFFQETQNLDPRLQKQFNESRDPRVQDIHSLPPFHLNSFNTQNQFPNHTFLNGFPMHPQLINTPQFGWQNNLQNPPPPLLVAQAFASSQSGMIPPSMINY